MSYILEICMRTQLWFIFFLTAHLLCFSKKGKSASFYFVPPGPEDTFYYSWTINGKAVDEKNRCSIPIHFPDADTIMLSHGKYTRTIITFFKHNHVYELNEGGWKNDVSIRDITERMRHSHKQEAGTGSLTVIFRFNNPFRDTLIAGSFGTNRWNFTHGKVNEKDNIITIEETEWKDEPGYPYNICIGTGTVRRSENTYFDSRFLNFDYDEDHVFVFGKKLLAFEFKFFDKKVLIVDYDCKNNRYSLKLK